MTSPMTPILRIATLCSALLATGLRAEVSLAPLFRDGAVLQQGKPVPVWGRADAGEKVSVDFQGQRKETTADAGGKWKVLLDPLPASASPAELTVAGTNTVKVSDLLVGEVWICSGQSNMAWTVGHSKDFVREAAAATHPLIRQFKVPLLASDKPEDVADGTWEICSPATVGDFTAVGYFFGRDLHAALGVPIGLINTSYGGTPVESWMSEETLRSQPAFAPVFERWKQVLADYPRQMEQHESRMKEWTAASEAAKAAGKSFTRKAPRPPLGPGSRKTPAGLFNAMVHPLLPYGIRGIIWYQGEDNAPRFTEYPGLFAAMITQWRRDFGQGDVPFYFVQLANLNRKQDPSGVQWAFQREAQATALELPQTGMVVTADIGEAEDIHPKNKQDVGRRLALTALALTYEKGGEYAGPVFRGASPENGAMRVRFDHAKGLALADDRQGTFELAGADRVFHPAAASVDGETLVVTSPEVASPTAIRYGWKNNPVMTIYNAAALPASPFRSDDWPAPPNALVLEVVPAPAGN